MDEWRFWVHPVLICIVNWSEPLELDRGFTPDGYQLYLILRAEHEE